MGTSGEEFEVVDEAGRVLGRAPRGTCHGDPSLIHRAVHVFVFDDEGRVLLQMRCAAKDIQPGKWDTSAGGHYLWRTDVECELVRTYRIRHAGPFTRQKSEIDQLGFFTKEELGALVGTVCLPPTSSTSLGGSADRPLGRQMGSRSGARSAYHRLGEHWSSRRHAR